MEQLPALFELSRAYHSARDVDSLTKTFTTHVGPRLKARAVLVWLTADGQQQLACRGGWFDVGERFEPAPGTVSRGLLREMLDATRARRLAPQEVSPKAVAHLSANDRERVKAALYAPLVSPKGVIGVVECLNKPGEFTAEDAAYLEEVSRLTGPALATLLSLEEDQRGQLATVERLTALYDIARIFNSTLELEDLTPVVAEKIRDICGAEVCNLWLIDSESNELYLSEQSGEDPTVEEDSRVAMGEGVLGEVAKSGEGQVVADAAEDERLAERRGASEEFEIRSVLAAPLLKEDEVLGVVEVLNKKSGEPFDEDDLFFLSSICEQAAIALHNANLLEAERKVHELDALLNISKEITSTLNLDHVLTTVVHQAATVVPFDRCVIGLYDRNKFVLGALSGEAEVPKTPEMEQLRQLLEWVGTQSDVVTADNYEEGWEVSAEEGKGVLTEFLDQHEYNGFYAMPLKDEQGTVGVLALLSGDSEFLTESHREILNILGNQTTVAIRNARLYQEVPLMSVWQPLVERKQKLLSVSATRWVQVGAVALLLIVVPWKMRVTVNATVAPADRRVVTSEVERVIRQVHVREGQVVEAGTVLAELDDTDDRIRLARAEADLGQARRDLAEAESRRDPALSTQARLRMQKHEAEATLYRERVERAQLRAPIAGVITTPKVEEMAGKLLAAGETFCEMVALDRLAVEMNVPETEVSLVRAENPVTLKLNTFPARTFGGEVERVSAQTLTAENEQFFVVRGLFDNPEGLMRPGMAGRAKIGAHGGWFDSGWYPVGYVLLRAPASWVWRKLWTWLP